MTLNNANAGQNSVPAYQLSGIPWVKKQSISQGSVVEIEFPYATRFFTIQNSGAAASQIGVAFTLNGFKPANSNYFTLTGSASYSADLRTTKLFISGTAGSGAEFTLIAGLTPVSKQQFSLLTGSNGYEGVG